MVPQYFENGDGARPYRHKQIGHLLDLLRDNGIQDQQSLREWIGGRSVIKHNDAEFQVVTAQDLGLDEENRWYPPEFKIREVIVDCEEVLLQNSSNIIIRDCAFLGSLIIGNKTGRPLSLSLDTVVVGDRLIVYGNDFTVSPASLTDVRSPLLRFDNFQCDDLHLSGCAFASTQLTRLTCDVLSVAYNQLGTLEVTDGKFKSVRFPPGQVDLPSLLHRPKSWTWLRRGSAAFRPFSIPPRRSFDEAADEISRGEAVRRLAETLNFLQEHSEDRFSRRDAAELKYLRARAESPGHLSTVLIFLTGALVKPIRVVGLAAATIILFAFAYLYGELKYDGKNVETVLEALYFSGLTFTTIGYGDITPMGFARFLAVLEGLLGIVLSSAFVVSLVRRHIE
ncbi:hypothetical protein AVMA1855_04535 [Acidovorax sp. SUPP1855]|uniref:potassium channel family protein n=1 Tax=Acidovorax sp. SUPP1855 TaxID=431774 RepID=UPI0023DE56DB|nr:potassium channel family protein [Acidovorax sp. SUPP1855]GKS83381.1 hypothetical protein AVMA1855_04535 [Acidovorax sp. SUPP1855]